MRFNPLFVTLFCFTLQAQASLPGDSTLCGPGDTEGVIFEYDYTQHVIAPEPYDKEVKITSYYLPEGHFSHSIGTRIEKDFTPEGTAIWRKVPYEKKTWTLLGKVYTHDVVQNIASVYDTALKHPQYTPLALPEHSASELKEYVGQRCVWATLGAGISRIATCTVLVFGKPLQIYSEIAATKAKSTPRALRQACVAEETLALPDLEWKRME